VQVSRDLRRGLAEFVNVNDLNSLIESGHALFAQRRFAEALRAFERVRQMAPGIAAPMLNEAICLRQLGRNSDAIVLLRQAVTIEPRSLPILTNLAQTLIEANNFFEAEQIATGALALDPENGYVLELQGGILKQTGRFEEALHAFARAMRAQPERISLALDYVSTRRMTEADLPILTPMFDSVASARLSHEQRISLHFAIAKLHDDLNDYETAIKNFESAHSLAAAELKSKGRSYNSAEMTSRFQTIVATFSRARLSNPSPASSKSARPLLIVGMVRSGTTLVEQIVTRHSQVAPGGELPFWPQNWQKLKPDGAGFSEADIGALSRAYSSLLVTLDSDASIVTDKMPGNYIALGSIHTVFPRAKVIYCKRNAIDNCVSIYTTPFRSGHDWIHKREDIVSYYRLHEMLMDHWRAVLPQGTMLEVQYEHLVTQPEATAREMIEFIGLDWEESCLTPEDNDRPVRTPSQWQVRQPVYRSSIDRWRNYEPWLGALSSLLSAGEKESR
jgi:tetratricopeptide (TPR) repeat protein